MEIDCINKVRFLEISFFLIVLAVMFAISGCTIYDKKIKGSDGLVDSHENGKSDYVLEGVTHYHYENGVLKILIEFDEGYYYKNDDKLEMFNCRFEYYEEDGDLASRGEARTAFLYSLKSKLIAIGNVVVVSEKNGTTLKTDELQWDGDSERFNTDSYVEITSRKGDVITGRGMVADIALRFVRIKHNVKGKIVSGKL